MAIGATCIWEVRTTGANTNGGGYTSGGVDKSQQDAAGWALTGCTSVGAGNTVLNANAHADMVGNVACCVSGTNFTISEFFEVLSVVAGVSITFGTSHAGASICTGVGANGVINIGGAFKIGGTLDDEWFDSIRAGNTVYIASTAGGVTYTLGETVAMASSGTGPLPITVQGYKDTRTTKPTGIDRPTIACGANGFSSSQYNIWKYLIFTTTHASGIKCEATFNIFLECKVNSLTGYGFYDLYGYAFFISCEAICTGGTAINFGSYSCGVNCYIHDSNAAIIGGGGGSISHSIIDTCVTGISLVTANNLSVLNNTIYNCVKGISGAAPVSFPVINNIITGCLTGASWTIAELINFWDFNCWNNTTDVTNVTKGPNDITGDPLLVSGLVSGTDGATGGTGLVFTAASAPFSGVTTGDCLLIKVGGTGATVGVYTISNVDSTSQITLATSAGANKTGITYGIVKGTNFTLGEGSPCFDAGLQPSSLIGIS